MGLLDYYRQFEGMSEEEVNAGLREDAAERKRKALMRVDTLDLSQTTWPELSHPSIVSAVTFVAQRGLHRYPHVQGGSQLHAEVAERCGVEPGRVILGNGAAELLSSTTRALIEPGQRLLSVWPTYPLFPVMARRANGQPVRVSGGVDGMLEQAREPGTRIIAIASPNDPTGELLETADLRRLLDGLQSDVAVLLDESLVEFSDAQPVSSSLELLAEHSRLFVFRSFSKAWGLAGLRVGYAIGGPGSEELLGELPPDLGVSEVSQAGALEALRSCSEIVARRIATVAHERAAVTEGLRERGFEVSDSQANFVWAAHPTLEGGELSARLARAGILIAGGAALGEPRHVRIGLRDPASTTRLLSAIDRAL